jgi:hypothetical protein
MRPTRQTRRISAVESTRSCDRPRGAMIAATSLQSIRRTTDTVSRTTGKIRNLSLSARPRTSDMIRKRNSNGRSPTTRTIRPRRKQAPTWASPIGAGAGTSRRGQTGPRSSCSCLCCCCSRARPCRRDRLAPQRNRLSERALTGHRLLGSAVMSLQSLRADEIKITDPKPPANLAARRAAARTRNPKGVPRAH